MAAIPALLLHCDGNQKCEVKTFSKENLKKKDKELGSVDNLCMLHQQLEIIAMLMT